MAGNDRSLPLEEGPYIIKAVHLIGVVVGQQDGVQPLGPCVGGSAGAGPARCRQSEWSLRSAPCPLPRPDKGGAA